MTRISCARFLSFIAVIVAPSVVRADLITTLTANVTPSENGLLFTYALANLASSDMSAISLDVEVDPLANLQDITSPLGWSAFYVPGDTTISWQSPDPDWDLAPSSVNIFSFSSTLGQGLGYYAVLGINETGPGFDFNDGTIAAPFATVPEPSTFVGFVLATGAFLFVHAWRGPRKEAQTETHRLRGLA